VTNRNRAVLTDFKVRPTVNGAAIRVAGDSIYDVLTAPFLWGASSNPASVALTAANDVVASKLIVPVGFAVGKLIWGTGTATAGNYDVGIYAADGQTKLWSKGITAAPAANTPITETVTGLTVVTGTSYWVAYTADASATSNFRGTSGTFAQQYWDYQGNDVIIRNTRGAWAALPATLTITGTTAAKGVWAVLTT
jgi:hypothetical protein